MRRIGIMAGAVGSAASQLLASLLLGLLFLIDAAPAPDPDETLSAVTGRRRADGAWWAQVAAPVIDVIMFLPDGARWHHCRRAAAAHLAREINH
ncbi:MAG: hypothetical protein KGQ52_13470 [Alphaproteobacteria bacterium]|nr:hypothetical protein [Alphaproteobacteria bacterium]